MHSATLPAPATKRRIGPGHVMSGLAVSFLLLDAVLHVLKPAPVLEAFGQLGYHAGASVPFGILELVCLALYVAPRTSALGAVLLTGYLGGAVAIHARVGSPLFSHLLFPVYVGALVWAGLYLRDERLRALVSERCPEQR